MMRKKIIVYLTMASMTISLLMGCGSSRQTEEVLVTPKEEKSGQATPGTEEQADNAVPEKQAAVAGTEEKLSSGNESEGIRQQVQAPERYETEVSQDGVSIIADAEIIVPKASGVQLYQVEARPFVQDDYDKVSRVLLQGASVWQEGDQQTIEEFIQEKRVLLALQEARIEEEVAAIEEEIALLPEGSEQDKSILTAKIKEYEKEKEVLREEYEIWSSKTYFSSWVVVTEVVSPNGQLNGHVTVKNEEYYVNLNNKADGNKQVPSFEVIKDEDSPGEYISLPDNSTPEGFHTDDIEQAARKLIEDMGFEEMEIFSSEYVVLTDTEKNCFCVHFTRVLQDIPVTYTGNMGDRTENYDGIPWAYERMDVLFDEQGFYDFIWYSPYRLTKQSEEYVFLMPFSDIQDIFTQMMMEKYRDYPQAMNSGRVNIEVQEVRLGYMRVREDENVRKGTMIPVWDFFGSNKDKSLMTINAMDGTIIDRELGY